MEAATPTIMKFWLIKNILVKLVHIVTTKSLLYSLIANLMNTVKGFQPANGFLGASVDCPFCGQNRDRSLLEKLVSRELFEPELQRISCVKAVDLCGRSMFFMRIHTLQQQSRHSLSLHHVAPWFSVLCGRGCCMSIRALQTAVRFCELFAVRGSEVIFSRLAVGLSSILRFVCGFVSDNHNFCLMSNRGCLPYMTSANQ